MIVVSDTGPLNYLIQISAVDVLPIGLDDGRSLSVRNFAKAQTPDLWRQQDKEKFIKTNSPVL